MPLYEYRCIRCKATITYMRRTEKRNEPAVCSECGAAARRIISKPQKMVEVKMSPEEIHRDKETWR